MSTELAKIIQNSDLAEPKAKALAESFGGFFAEAAEAIIVAKAIEVTDVSQVGAMKAAFKARQTLKTIRTTADKTRKALKEESLREGRAIQDVYNLLESIVEPEEKRLKDAEDFAVNKEAERVRLLVSDRTARLLAVQADPTLYKLAEMEEAAFSNVLATATAEHAARLEEARKEQERIEAEAKARAEEQARVRAENERLRKEAEEREAAMRAERAEADRKAREAEAAAKAEREKIEAAARAEREALEAKAKAEQQEAARKAQAEREAIEKAAREEREAAAKAAREAEAARKRVEAASAKLLEACKAVIESFGLADTLPLGFPNDVAQKLLKAVAEAEAK